MRTSWIAFLALQGASLAPAKPFSQKRNTADAMAQLKTTADTALKASLGQVDARSSQSAG